jgi:hypothetical protein
VHDVGSPLFGSSKPRERGSSTVSLLRGKRGGDDGLISFNLLPVETEDGVVPGRVSDTRLMLVHYWRRDQQAAAEAAAEIDAAPPRQEALIPASEIYVNGAAVLPPAISEPASTQAGRPDLLTALRGSSNQIPLPPSGLTGGVNGTASNAAAASSSLFVEPVRQEAPPPVQKAPSIFERRPREAADAPSPSTETLIKPPVPSEPAAPTGAWGASVQDRLADIVRRAEGALVEEQPVETAQEKDQEAVWAKFRASVDAVSRGEPHQFDPSELLKPEPAAQPAAAAVISEPLDTHQPSPLGALEVFLRRVAIRRQQIESQSVA